MRLIDKIKSEYSTAPVHQISVPEWDTVIYFKRLTTEELDVSESETPDGVSATHGNARLVVLKALDADGKRLFSNSDAEMLISSADPKVINRIASEMVKVRSIEDKKKS
jgi:hypothetical protein